jgi:tetratricopeptide (TPR) repeat protein
MKKFLFLMIAAAMIVFAGCKDAKEYFTKGYNAQENGLNELAIEYYQKAVSIDPKHANGYNNMGTAYYDLQNYRDAIRCYEKAIAINPNYAAAYVGMGDAYYNLQNYHEAVRCYEKAIAINPNYAAAYNNMGAAYFELGNKKEGIKSCQQAARLGYPHAQEWLRENGYKW